MENISGNLANSQTIGYKKIDTAFVDMVLDAPTKSQVPGAMSAYSRSTNNVRGDIQSAATETYMALNGTGFFVVEPATGDTSGTLYTRRGDFDLDKSGYLVNGAGYRLKGVAMEGGVVKGSVAEAIKIDKSFMPAQKTNTINYQLNLPQVPKTAAYVATTPNSELMNWSDFAGVTGGAVATATGAATTAATVANTLVGDNETLTIKIGATTRTYRFDTNGAPSAGVGEVSIDANAPRTVAQVLADIQLDIQANVPNATTATIGVVGPKIQLDMTGNYTDSVTFGGTNAGLALGGITATPVRRDVNNIAAADIDDFTKQSITGGGVTVYSDTGEPINLQLRWAKIDNTAGAEKWSLRHAHGCGDAVDQDG
jgi:flagellar hook protein FlgE